MLKFATAALPAELRPTPRQQDRRVPLWVAELAATSIEAFKWRFNSTARGLVSFHLQGHTVLA